MPNVMPNVVCLRFTLHITTYWQTANKTGTGRRWINRANENRQKERERKMTLKECGGRMQIMRHKRKTLRSEQKTAEGVKGYTE